VSQMTTYILHLSYLQSCPFLIHDFATRITRRVPVVEQEHSYPSGAPEFSGFRYIRNSRSLSIVRVDNVYLVQKNKIIYLPTYPPTQKKWQTNNFLILALLIEQQEC
jgi:hypothetical protein